MSNVDCTFDQANECGELTVVVNLSGKPVRLEARFPGNPLVWFSLGALSVNEVFESGAGSMSLPGGTVIRVRELDQAGNLTSRFGMLGTIVPGVENVYTIPLDTWAQTDNLT